MRTLVFQSYRTVNVPQWIDRCRDSVREWATRCGFDYQCLDDSFFAFAPQWYREHVNNEVLLVADLARLVAARTLLNDGYDRVVWIDADVLVFQPELFAITVENEYAFSKEVFIWPAALVHPSDTYGESEGLRPDFRVQNSVCAFVKGNSILDFYIHSCESLVRRQPPGQEIGRAAVGTRLLSWLYSNLPFPLIRGAALFGPLVLRDIAAGSGKALRLHSILFGEPVYAANLCGSFDKDVLPSSLRCTEGDYEQVVEQLLVTRGAVVNCA
jgi:hypothetical protein